MKRMTIFMFILALAGMTGIAQETEPAITYDLAAETFAEMIILLDQAIYLTTTAVLSAEDGSLRAEHRERAQGVLNLLVGPDDELYDAGNGFTVLNQRGLLPLMEQIRSWDGGAPIDELFPDYTYGFSNAIASFLIAWELAESALHEASAVALSMAFPGSSFPWREELTTLYSLLVAVRGGSVDAFPLGGISTLAEQFPSREIWVDPDESIQDAVDRVPDGGTIYISPGTYREMLTITKNLSLVAASHAPNGQPELGQTVLEGMIWRAAIEIASSDAIDVSIQGLVIRDAGVAISAAGSCNVTALDARFEDNRAGFYVDGGGNVIAESCYFTGNVHAVTLRSGVNCLLVDSVIEDSPSTQHVISVMCSTLELRGCEIRDNQGPGITVHGSAASELQMTNSRILRNSFGLELFYEACPLEPLSYGSESSVLGERSFATITGWENSIPGPDEEDGNTGSAFLFHPLMTKTLDLSFLTEPKPETE